MKNILIIVALAIIMGLALFFIAKKWQGKKSMPSGTFNGNIIELAKKNDFFRKEIVTGPHSQVVLMSVDIGEDIGEEIHEVDQTLIFVQGQGQTILNGHVGDIAEGSLVFVPAGTKHNFKNTGNQPLKLFTVYAPAEHKPGTVAKEKTEY